MDKNKPVEADWVRAGDLAQEYSVSRSYLINLGLKGILKSIRLPGPDGTRRGNRRYSRSAFEKLLEETNVQA